ncbi:Outer membrane protein assembly factor BamD, BamD/ComL family [Epilithonimonas bovis DSM 19482]|uniref:Outer membrane protein assembly factor BamD, BamD/ComL family n=1 Tax=Epilithonimonas bovis DSM 19482 TaxID=1121284 RepID=A0A1U7PUD0_9FLAO|nr:tetratricopeptide repeat protein [Epilithonimonas bovis]SIT95593.1 Outer membrane protein assembly factor BamD, BamD/ComL family [Epilithonimonas bovis DSM 19482]
MNSKKVLLASLISFYGISDAQQSQYFTQKEDYHFGLAENLYNTKVYNASQYEYSSQYFYNKSLSNSRKEAALFFSNVIGVILQQQYAEEGLNAFMKEYPKSAYFAQANGPLADYYLGKKDFEKALQALQNVNQYQLSKEENTQYIMKLGYAKFMTGDSAGAIEALEESFKTADETSKPAIAYMLGHLYYADKQNENAFVYFDQIKNNEEYAHLVKPYYVQMYYNQKKYDLAISEGNDILNTGKTTAYDTEIHKIVGESYFMKGDYQSAYPHLKLFLDKEQSPSESDLYEMGFVSSQVGKNAEAVGYYNQLINSNSPLAQNAYYQLGNAYLQNNQKQEALSAYRNASQMNYDAKVQQLALEQYAKLGYELGNPFENSSKVIQRYLDKYPKSAKTQEMRSLLVKSYLYSGDYKATLDALAKLDQKTNETKKIEQEVSYLLGSEEFNKGNFDTAESYFKRSLQYNLNKDFYKKAQYWLGQTYYQKGDYKSAIAAYTKLENETADGFPEREQLDYDLGYAYFKSKDFTSAQEYFKEYLRFPKQEYKADAELRLADTYYANNQLNEALDIYNKADNASDYTLYQKALALGFKGDTLAKITELKALISKYPNSEYVDDASYEIATAYAQNDEFDQSNSYFDKVIRSSPDKDLVANSQIYRAQNYIDQNLNDKAIAEFRQLANQYKNTAYADKIVAAAKPAFVKNGDVAGYEQFAKGLNVNVSGTEISEINLNLAQDSFSKKDYTKAVTYYEKYLDQSPSGDNLFKAQYELGESYYQLKQTDKALLPLQNVADFQNDYQQEAQVRLAQIYLAQDKVADAKKYLEQTASSTNVTIKNFSSVELMKIYADEKNFAEAEKYANAVIANTKNSAATLEQAKVIKARSLMQQGKDKDAQTAYTALEKSSNTEVAAEALYAKAFYQNKGKAFKSSNETIFKLANNYASEEYWGAKALVIMAKNYLALKDNYQASYTVDEIINNYGDFPEVVAEAKEVKAQIKK